MTLAYLETLAREARPTDDDDYGSIRQVACENAFYDILAQYLASLPVSQRDAFDAYCLKATTDERIDEGLRLAKQAVMS